MSLTIVIYFRPFYNWLVTVMGHITGLCSEKDHQLFLRRRHSVFPPLNHVPTTVRSHHAVLLLHTPIEVKHLDVKYHHGRHRISSNRIMVQKHKFMKQVFNQYWNIKWHKVIWDQIYDTHIDLLIFEEYDSIKSLYCSLPQDSCKKYDSPFYIDLTVKFVNLLHTCTLRFVFRTRNRSTHVTATVRITAKT